jgi:copper chaperone CopZ
MAEFTLKIDGMHCGSCVRRVSQALAATEGMVVNEVRLGAARVTSPRDTGHCGPGQSRLHGASGSISGYTRDRIAYAARSGDDVR